MAESVARVKIQATADLKGFEDASKALKDLQRAVGPTDAALEQVRKEILDFAAANKRSEAVIQAQLNAFQKLRQQAEMGGKVYNDLGRDIDRLKQVISGSTGSITKLNQAISSAGKSASGRSVWEQQTKELAAFNRQAGQTGKAVSELAASFNVRFEKAGNAIQEASRQIDALRRNASNIGGLMQGPQQGGGVFEFGRKGLSDIQRFAALVKGLKEQTETATGKVARLSEGMFALGATGVAVGQVTNALGGVAGAAERVSSFGANLSGMFAQMGASTPQWSGPMKAALNQVSLLLNQPANGIANWAGSLADVQARLNMLNAPLEAFGQAIAAIGPEGAAAAGVMAVAFAGLQDGISRAFKAGEKDATEALQGITNETQQLLQKLAQLSEAFRGAASMNELRALLGGAQARFNQTPAGTDASRRAANSIASAEAQIKAEGMAQAQVLENARQRYRGTTESVDALSERLAFLQSAMKLVDQSTAEGKAEFANFSREAAEVKKRIDDLGNSYRTVADAIRDAAQAQGQYANQSTTANYFNRAAARRQEELAQAARDALARPSTPLLPAAGQTSFAGDVVNGLGGGARRLLSNFETAGTRDTVGAPMSSLSEALDRASGGLSRARSELDGLQRELNETLRDGARLGEVLSKVEVSNPNSINALRARREQIEKERSSVDMLSKDYRRLSRELDQVDQKLERTQPGNMRGNVGYVGQGIGAIASAGFFGGPEGALAGALGGGLGAKLGGAPGFATGAFIGSSIGAYASQIRQQIALLTDYAAQVKKQEIALKGVSGSAAGYERAMQAVTSVMRDFNVPQLEATQGMTKLTAAVVGAGGRVADAELVFRNITAAIKATGGSAQDVEGAMTALTQVFSKGKVSAEELQGQLGERLAGAVTMFAEATGRTLPQLQEDLQKGVVDLNDLMKFVVSLGDRYADAAMKMGKSSADAGERLKTTFSEVRKQIGDALMPLGAELQDSLGQALRDAAPAIISAAKGIAGALKFLFDNGQAIASMARFAATAGAVVVGMRALSAAMAFASKTGVALALQFSKLSTGMTVLNASSLLAASGAAKLGLALRSLLRIGVITIAIELVGSAIGKAMEVSALREELEKLKKAAAGASAAERARRAMEGASRETVVDSIRRQRAEYERLGKELDELIKKREKIRQSDLQNTGFDVEKLLGFVGLSAKDEEIERLRLLRDAAKGFLELNPDDYESELTQFQKRLEENSKESAQQAGEDLIEARKNALREIEDLERKSIEDMAELRKQTIKEAIDLERDLVDERKEIQREIDRIGREAAYDRTRSALGDLIDASAGDELATAALETERELNEIRVKYAEQIQQNREQYEDAINGRARQLEDFKRKVAEAIAQLQEGVAKQAGEIQRSYALNVFEILERAGKAAGEGIRQGAVDANGILNGGSGGDGASTNQGSKLLEAFNRIKGAYQFRSADSNVPAGFYQSDPRENKFFEFNQGLSGRAAERIKTLTQNDIRAMVFTALGEAGPTANGFWEVIANVLVRSLKSPNASIARLVTMPSQYAANLERGANERNIVDPAFGRQVFGARFEEAVRKLNQDVMAPFLRQVEAVLQQRPPRGGAIITDRNDPDGWQAGADIVVPGGRGGQIQSPFTSARVTGTGYQFNPATGRGFGNYVTAEIEMNNRRYEVMFAHLDKIAVKIGDIVQMGQSVGTQGMTGSATGPHVSTHVNALNGGNSRAVLDAILNAWVQGRGIQSVAMQGGRAGAAAPGTTGPLPMPQLPPAFNTAPIFAGVDAAASANDAANATLLASQNAKAWNQQIEEIKQSIRGINADFNNLRASSLNTLDSTQAYAELLRSGVTPELAQQLVDARRIAELQEARLTSQRDGLQSQIDGGSLTKEQAADYQKIIDSINQQLSAQPEILAAYEQQLRVVDQIKRSLVLPEYIAKLRQELQNMTNIQQVLVSVAGTVEESISSAMSNAVSAVVTGSTSVKQVLADTFRSIGQTFVKMATDIIAKQMVMIVLQSILKALGGGLFGGGGASAGATNVLSAGKLAINANGNAYGPSGPIKFAKGGIVSRPTFFKFANGGTMQNGVMGEAGPEAIVPLKRGYDGRLGIAQVRAPQGGDTRMREMMGRSPAQQQAPTLNLKFETTKINGVEYVSKDQLEIAMAQTRRQAANDGAKRGMNMTLDKIQNSPSTRSRVGIR